MSTDNTLYDLVVNGGYDADEVANLTGIPVEAVEAMIAADVRIQEALDLQYAIDDELQRLAEQEAEAAMSIAELYC